MATTKRLPYVYEKNGAFFIRVVVPPSLRPFVENGKGEILRLLGHSLRDVKTNHARALASAQDERDAARARKAEAEGVELAQTARRYLPKTVDQMALDHYTSELHHDLAERAYPERLERLLWSRGPRLAALKKVAAGLADNDKTDAVIGWAIDEFRRRGNHKVDSDTAEWRRLAMTLAGAQIEAMARVEERDAGDFNGAPRMPILKVAEPTAKPAITFEQIIDEEVIRRNAGKDARGTRPSTIKQFRRECAAFAAHRGSDDATTVTHEEGEAWIAARQSEGKLSNKTIGGGLFAVKAVLTWGRRQRRDAFPAAHPLQDVRKPIAAQVPTHERVFTMAEAKTILTAAKAEKNPTLRFLPWVAAYSGARVSEISSLLPEDFFEIEGHWFYAITSSGGRSTKTLSSIRRVPVHPVLVDYGLIEHVKATAPGVRLFNKNAQPRISEWMKNKVKLSREHMAPNHSWRHLFEDLLSKTKAPDDVRAYVTGRGTGTSRDRYGRSDVALPGLAEEIAKIVPLVAP